MIRFLTIVSCILFFTSCASKKNIPITKKRPQRTNTTSRGSSASNQRNKIVSHALNYLGTPYKFGGVTKRGMDCSGLIITAFKNENIILPHSSAAIANLGSPISLNKIKKGDLLFFKTSKKSRKINHVGMVSKIYQGTIYFIHSSSSRGVMESSLSNKYWSSNFVRAKQLL